MAHHSPTISIPKKSTEEVDWTNPIRNVISQSYGENPDNYAAECATLQRCRQDAVRGAGSDMTARDLLYKYFGQLELLELRFSEIKVNFCWHDAFTKKAITQTSIAYEKASILFQIASTHSSIASSQNRSDPEGLKRAFYYFRTCAGMLTYINENFLHAPSTDLSRDVVKFLVSIILAQATEVFFEKCTEEKKGAGLISKIGSQAATMYSTISEEAKEFMGKGIFDRNWISLIQIKAKYFSSLAQYYRAIADSAAGKHGDALVRYTLAETLAKEASRLATSFASAFVTNLSPTLPADAGPSLQDRMKAHLAVCTERKNEATRENDLIYNAILPSIDALPVIEKTTVASPIPIQEVYGNPDVQKTIGQDIFLRLVPLSVHESASVYSEEKAKLVRAEVEKGELAEVEAKSVLDGIKIREGLVRFRAMAEGEISDQEDVPVEVRQWKENIQQLESRNSVDTRFAELSRMKEAVRKELATVAHDLDVESKDCESMRVKYGHRWEQEPSAGLNKSLRQDVKSHQDAFEAASTSDRQVENIWISAREDVLLFLSPNVEQVFKASAEQGSQATDLLDLDLGNDEAEKAKIGGYVAEIEERLGRINKIARERHEVLKDLKEKVQSDDVSHLLLLNRRGGNVEPTLFAAELEKFAPHQQRLAATVYHQEIALQEISRLWKALQDFAGKGAGARKWDEREKNKKDTIRRFSNANDSYLEVQDGLSKGHQFYQNLLDLTAGLRDNVRSFVSGRVVEREALIAKLEQQQTPPPMRPPPPPSAQNLDSAFQSMRINSTSAGSPISPPPVAPAAPSWQNLASPQQSIPPPPPSAYAPISPPNVNPNGRTNWLPPPPPPPPHPTQLSPVSQPTLSPPPGGADPYASLSLFNPAAPAPPSTMAPPPPPPQQFYSQPPAGYPNILSNSQAPMGFTASSPPPVPSTGYQYQSPSQAPMGSGFPPPPPTHTHSSYSQAPPHPDYSYSQQYQPR